MDRSLLEGNPHSVLEGMIIGAFAIGASQGYIYVRDEYPLAVKHIAIAVEQAREYGFIGNNILGFDFDFDMSIWLDLFIYILFNFSSKVRIISLKNGRTSVFNMIFG